MYAASIILASGGLSFFWDQATVEGKVIIVILAVFSIFAWSVMASKAMQMRQAKRLNYFFNLEFREQERTLAVHEREIDVKGCPLYTVYRVGCVDLTERLKKSSADAKGKRLTWKSMEHVKQTMERTVAEESLRLESGLILLAIAVSGAPFLGLLGTVWGVMGVFSEVAMKQTADLPTMAPGLSAAMMTTVAGLLVAIPSMFGYNWLVHNLRVFTVELDNFAQELASRMETEFLLDDDGTHKSN